MNRRSFLQRAAVVIGAVAVGRKLELPPAEEPTFSFPEGSFVFTDGIEPLAVSDLVATGGLCAPLTPFYEMPAFPITHELIPTFSASRGGIELPPALDESGGL